MTLQHKSLEGFPCRPPTLLPSPESSWSKTVTDRRCGVRPGGEVRLRCRRHGRPGRHRHAFRSRQPVDGAFIDIDLNGTAASRSASSSRKRHIPFVFLTGHRCLRRPRNSDRAGLHKPVDDRDRPHWRACPPAVREQPRQHDPRSLADRRLVALQPHLEASFVGWRRSDRAGETRYVYFPISGLISVSRRAPARQAVEVALVGRKARPAWK